MKKIVTMRQALSDPALLADALPGDSWSAWRTILIACMGEELTPDEREVFAKLTGGREREPGEPVEMLLVVAGRRSGKSRAMSVLATYLACLCDWSEHLFIGEVGIALYQAPTQRQAASALRYATDLIDHVELLSKTVENRTTDCLTLRRSIELTATAANWRYSRGSTCICCVLDECAFFHNDEASANSDEELLTALTPSLGTTGGPMLIASSPKDMEGIVYDLHKKHFGKDGDAKLLVIQADSRALNPSLRASVVTRAFEADPVRAAAEYGGEFREATSSYLERSVIDKAIEKGMARRVPLPGIKYFAFLDSAGGSGSDSYATAIGHNIIEDGRIISVIDQIYEAVPPFDPDIVTRAAAETLKQWNIREVYGDSYGGAWPVTAMAKCGIRYVTSPLNTSELYLHTLPLWNAGRVRMLDSPKAIEQIARLRRRVGQGVAEKIVHPRNGHDDSANVIAGVLWLLSPVQRQVISSWAVGGVVRAPNLNAPGQGEEADTMRAWMASQGRGYIDSSQLTGIHRGAPVKGSAVSNRNSLVW
jgi:hypothetical protein